MEYASIQAGLPRTGSTLIWQIANSLLGPTRKAHTFVKTELPLLVTYRDPRDSVVSDWRCKVNPGEDELMPRGALVSYMNRHRRLFQRINGRFRSFYQNKNNIAWFRYEDFVDDYDYIFDKIETTFSLEISQEQRESLCEQFGLEANRERSKAYDGFKQYDTESKIHGNHIRTGKPGTWQEFLSPTLQKLMTNGLKGILVEWGYEKS